MILGDRLHLPFVFVFDVFRFRCPSGSVAVHSPDDVERPGVRPGVEEHGPIRRVRVVDVALQLPALHGGLLNVRAPRGVEGVLVGVVDSTVPLTYLTVVSLVFFLLAFVERRSFKGRNQSALETRLTS